jgi:hypothetical protein
MLVVGLVVAIPVTLVLRSGDEAGPAAELPEVGKELFERDLGVKYRVPRGWRSRREEDVLTLRSRDGAARIAISAPAPARDDDVLFDEALEGLRREYRRLDVLRRIKKSTVGGLRARSVAIEAKPSKRGSKQRILLSTARGDKRAYLIVVFTAPAGGGESLVESQALLNELRLLK